MSHSLSQSIGVAGAVGVEFPIASVLGRGPYTHPCHAVDQELNVGVMEMGIKIRQWRSFK